ncbi:hypothetical protein BDN70DRAFT_975528 [Pholiota conissans]|uniref:Uncharacterized protein n=1 Tax=Pholiota conissans TaxID=109636 RepID=A0A9P5YMG3_9AGAR|nr:hypothetical protein BDN70DRAFT_975528 [Pholiota conissans]
MDHGTHHRNLGEEIKQHSKVYANISEVNALKAMMPELERKRELPRVSSPSNTAPSPTPSTGCTTRAQAVTKERAAPVNDTFNRYLNWFHSYLLNHRYPSHRARRHIILLQQLKYAVARPPMYRMNMKISLQQLR